ncbi:hypothetical protein LUD75_14650 [Epilithonimonas sp. JDS]|uniref:hypothetical protein n=1 Tax=Epilithonimonas sp. JDS TaxID=2902797 RepID=UPI001E63AFC2|nr:hypothetical protein [Epilithonimonas sp. JDS]MCD9855963.1 hypothetical protein [Epilithonimonas sp. JDS]
MNSDLNNKKTELLQWISDLQDKDVILELLELKNNLKISSSVNESKTEYALKDDFEERWAKGLTKEQSIERSKSKIRGWWGK